MNATLRRLIAIIIAIAAVTVVTAQGGSTKHPLNEGAALNLLLETLKRDHVYDKRISLDCVTFSTDETTRIYFEFSLHENHTAKCGGDADTSPVVDRYRVNRGSGKIELYDAADAQWRPYNSKRVNR